MNKAFFLDRDGTLNKDTNNVHSPEEWIWREGALKALTRIQELGFTMIVVTNQAGISKGLFDESDTIELHKWVDDVLKSYNITIDGWYYSPYHPAFDSGNYDSRRRKPGTGMFEKAAREHQIDFSKSYMAGDKMTDMQPAVELGIAPFFIRSRFEPYADKKWLKKHHIPCFDSLLEAVETIISE
jgi:D-glycero-D-manno-heptose 1,7-bisphosphate phosphatase